MPCNLSLPLLIHSTLSQLISLLRTILHSPNYPLSICCRVLQRQHFCMRALSYGKKTSAKHTQTHTHKESKLGRQITHMSIYKHVCVCVCVPQANMCMSMCPYICVCVDSNQQKFCCLKNWQATWQRMPREREREGQRERWLTHNIRECINLHGKTRTRRRPTS